MKAVPIAVLASDLHLSHASPRARSDDWYAAMCSHLRELREATTAYAAEPIPLIVAGDVFDSWSVPPEIISFAIRELPPCFAIPGQHDLPNHSYEDITRSGYWALVEAGIIKNLRPCKPTRINDGLSVVGVPWGFEIPKVPLRGKHQGVLLAAIHAYIWDRERNSYVGAPQDKSIGQYTAQLTDYDAAVFGDNHKGFLAKSVDGEWGQLQSILNCGGFMRRKTDDAWQPKIGLLYSDGNIRRITLESASADKLQAVAERSKRGGEVDMSFLNAADKLQPSESFLDSVKQAADADGIPHPVSSALRRIWRYVQEST